MVQRIVFFMAAPETGGDKNLSFGLSQHWLFCDSSSEKTSNISRIEKIPYMTRNNYYNTMRYEPQYIIAFSRIVYFNVYFVKSKTDV